MPKAAKKTPNLTPLELAGIKGIMESEYNGNFPDESSDIWSQYIWTLTASQRPGVCSSLVKKGLAKTSETNDMDTIWLTEAGVAAYRANFRPEDR